MRFRSDDQVPTMNAGSSQTSSENRNHERSVRPCNFRATGRISNENLRLLTDIHEAFAHHVANAMDVYLGTGIDVKLQSLEQVPIREYIAGITPFSYLASASFNPSGILFIDCHVNLVFPIIDLLLGGTSVSATELRELSEIEDELMRDLMSLIALQAEVAWRLAGGSFTACQRIRPTTLNHLCPPNERVTLVRFEMEILQVTGTFQLVLPTSFMNILIKQSRLDPARKKHGLHQFPPVSIRKRVLDCDFTVAAEIPPMRIPVRELVALQPGTVLKLKAPVSSPAILMIANTPIFEALPVRNGAQKAAQLTRRIPANQFKAR